MNALQALNEDLAAVVAAAQTSLVQVHAGGGAGAGTVWHAHGLILTNAHVAGRKRLEVVLPDGRSLPAKLLAADVKRDLAALHVAATDLRPIALGDSQRLRTGQWVFAIGHPWGVANAVTAGIVIGGAIERPAGMAPGDWLAVSLHLRPGFSGGALVDDSGQLVGINTLMTGPDVGMAIPVHVARRFLQDALAQRK